MLSDPLNKAWFALVALSGASAVVAELAIGGLDRRVVGAMILLLALMKARVILSRYLGLAEAPSWRRGFNLVLTLFCLLLLGLYLIPALIS